MLSKQEVEVFIKGVKKVEKETNLELEHFKNAIDSYKKQRFDLLEINHYLIIPFLKLVDKRVCKKICNSNIKECNRSSCDFKEVLRLYEVDGMLKKEGFHERAKLDL